MATRMIPKTIKTIFITFIDGSRLKLSGVKEDYDNIEKIG